MWTCWPIILINFAAACHAVYFTMTDVQVQIPIDKNAFPSGKGVLANLYAATESALKPRRIKYSINGTDGHYLQIRSKTGEVFFANEFFEAKDTPKGITSNIVVQDSSGSMDRTSFEVNINLVERLDCYFIIEDLCYWQSVKYRILENSKTTLIGSLNSPYLAEMCEGFSLNYTLTKGQDQIDLVAPSDVYKSWSIRSLRPIDRDVVRSMNRNAVSGEMVNITVKCTVEDPQHTSREVYKDLTIRVLDVDDNPPVAQEDVLNIGLDSNIVHKGQMLEHKHFIFIDRDSSHVNHYDFHITDDVLNILEPICTTYEDDRQTEPQTVIHCKLMITRDMQMPNSTYSVVLQINDTSLVSKQGDGVVEFPVHIHPQGYKNHLSGSLSEQFDKPLLLYPSRIVKILKTAGPLARVTQPKQDNSRGAHSFFISNSTNSGVFDVTPSEGILYVHNVTALRKSPNIISLDIHWIRNNKLESDQINVRLISEATETCRDSESFHSWSHCSNYKSPKECSRACSIATGGTATVKARIESGTNQRCMWRGERNPGPEPTHMYSTCTPDKETCPDGTCDSLEELHFLICPQDCSTKIDIPTQINPHTHRGIDVAAGICTCDNTGQCRCDYYEEKKKDKDKANLLRRGKAVAQNYTTAQPNVSRHTGVELAKCGTTCMLGIGAAALFLIGAVSLVVVCWRLDRVHKAVRGKFSDEPADLSAPLSDYVDRGVVPDNLHLNFDMTSSLTNNISNKTPDPKWEFPRNQLIIEQTLGEGEFGRVLRARALDIGGQPGYTTVAVKTLKDDAREAELADLLSEYELLKEVSHPNIIRLLGASTVPGGPVYLIIEFAQYGSLRSYLRRSRHLKSECNRLPSSGRLTDASPREDGYDEPHVYKVTPKEIISFAWQISNGMAYLSEIKLVHRDLAARNVLLATGKICKISDFGLTRDIYEDDAYFKRSKGRVPVKWMAPESLSDHIYTTQSDVWSFGILVWELVTLGATPYPGIAVQNLFHLLRSGYRMERPENCSPALYKIMRSCWHLQPDQRPTFQELSRQWEKMLSDEVEYLDLTNNAIHNRSYFCTNFEDNEEDELAMNKMQSDAVNYLTKSQSYSKCGESNKFLESNEDSQSQDTNVTLLENTEGYETPVKIPKKIKTPSNENPQYYTDMDACKIK